MSQHFNGRPSNGSANGSANGNGTGTSYPVLDLQPDLHQALEEAIEISAQRGTPLTALASQAMGSAVAPGGFGAPNAQLPNSSNGAFRNTPVPPWNAMPPEILQGIRQVDIMQSLAPLAPRMKAVEREIERLITTPVKLVADIAGHVLGAGGKRLRPALTLLSAEICDGSGENPSPRAVTCAALVELTHTTTLLHDDVVDSATMRRGKPAANLIWGNETSVLVGDYLFAQVFVTASRRGIAELMHPLAHATAQMCAGELLETQMRGFWEMTEKQYLEIVALKTGSLTECACRMGALAVNADEETVEALGTYGRSIGVAFQIVDDVFDVISSEEGLGKPVGNDLREGAITLPMLRSLKNSPDRDELQNLLTKEEKSDADVLRALEIMRGGDAVSYAMQLAQDYAEAAKDQLKRFPNAPACEMLCDIADYVLSREK
jgi:geranylgeranyl pyrophosphate synthase